MSYAKLNESPLYVCYSDINCYLSIPYRNFQQSCFSAILIDKINSLYSISFLRVFPRNGTSNGKKKEVGDFASRTYMNPDDICVKTPRKKLLEEIDQPRYKRLKTNINSILSSVV